MSGGLVPYQIPWLASFPKKTNDRTATILGGQLGESSAKMEGRANAKEREIDPGAVSVVCYGNTCDDGTGPADEDYCGHEQSMQGVSVVQEGRGKWRQLHGGLGSGVCP